MSVVNEPRNLNVCGGVEAIITTSHQIRNTLLFILLQFTTVYNSRAITIMNVFVVCSTKLDMRKCVRTKHNAFLYAGSS